MCCTGTNEHLSLIQTIVLIWHLVLHQILDYLHKSNTHFDNIWQVISYFTLIEVITAIWIVEAQLVLECSFLHVAEAQL